MKRERSIHYRRIALNTTPSFCATIKGHKINKRTTPRNCLMPDAKVVINNVCVPTLTFDITSAQTAYTLKLK